MNREEILKCVAEVIGEFNSTLDKEHRIRSVEPSSVIIGPGGDLDSLGTVNFLLLVEERMSEILNTNVSLLDEEFLLRFSDQGMKIEDLIDTLTPE